MPEIDLQSQSEGGNVLQSAIRSAKAAHAISNTFPALLLCSCIATTRRANPARYCISRSRESPRKTRQIMVCWTRFDNRSTAFSMNLWKECGYDRKHRNQTVPAGERIPCDHRETDRHHHFTDHAEIDPHIYYDAGRRRSRCAKGE